MSGLNHSLLQPGAIDADSSPTLGGCQPPARPRPSCADSATLGHLHVRHLYLALTSEPEIRLVLCIYNYRIRPGLGAFTFRVVATNDTEVFLWPPGICAANALVET